MIVKCARYITTRLMQEDVIGEGDRDIYQYGLELIVSTIINLALTIILGVLLHSLLPAIGYFFILATLRTQAGGYHASSYVRCDVIYVCMLLITIGGVRILCQIQIDSVIPLLIIVIDLCVIGHYAPVLHKKKLDQEEQAQAKRKAVIRGILWGVAMVILRPYVPDISYTVLVTVTIVTVFMLVGRMMEVREHEQKSKTNIIKRSSKSI